VSFRNGLFLFLALVVFDGAVRKWLLPESEQVVYILKDLVLLAMLGAYVLRFGLKLPAGIAGTALVGWLGMYVVITALQVLNPSLPSLLLGLVGLKTHILYAALLVLVPATFRDTEDLVRALRYMIVPIVFVLVLGILQFGYPLDHPINRYVRGTTQDIATFGLINRVRITSTFSYVSGMTVFVFFALCLGVALLAAGRWRLASNKLTIACIIAAVVVTPMTGARWIYYMLMLSVPVFLFGMVRSSMLQTRYALRLVILGSLGVAAVSLGSIEALESFEQRRQVAADTQERIESLLLDPFKLAADAGLIGYGAGSTHQVAPALVRDAGYYQWLPTTDFEDETGRIMLELGIVGFVVVFALRVYLCRMAWLAMVNGGSRNEKALAGGALAFFLAHLVSPIVFNVTGGALYWFFAGVVATILRDQHARRIVPLALPYGLVSPAPGRATR
jgi:hypothetical protein